MFELIVRNNDLEPTIEPVMFRKICDGDEAEDGFNKHVEGIVKFAKITFRLQPRTKLLSTFKYRVPLLGARLTIWQKWNVFY